MERESQYNKLLTMQGLTNGHSLWNAIEWSRIDVYEYRKKDKKTNN